MKVFNDTTNQNIIFHGVNLPMYHKGELQAARSGDLITITNIKNNDILVIKDLPHTDFTDVDGDSFGTSAETVTALNNIFDGDDAPFALAGSGVPSVNIGVVNNIYIDVLTLNFYKKTGSGWGSPLARLTGGLV